MTKIGYAEILERIRNHKITPPDDLTADQMIDWLSGYYECMKDVTAIIKELEEDYH